MDIKKIKELENVFEEIVSSQKEMFKGLFMLFKTKYNVKNLTYKEFSKGLVKYLTITAIYTARPEDLTTSLLYFFKDYVCDGEANE